MSKRRTLKPMFSLAKVQFKNSPIEGRGVFARRAFEPGETVVAYAPKQRRLPAGAAEAIAAAETKLTLLSERQFVIIPDVSVPGGWLCNHSCRPNAAIYSDGEGRIQCTRPIAPGDEVTIFYGWVTQNEPERDLCRCGAQSCRGYINFDVTTEDAAHVDAEGEVTDPAFRRRLDEYGQFLRSIDQEQVKAVIMHTLLTTKRPC